MTDKEIIKALECCSKKDCKQCPAFDENIECGENTITLALDLINRLKRQSNQYRNQAQAQKGELTRLYKQVTEQKAEIERLQKAGEEAISCFTRMESIYKIKCKELEVAKTEAIKEFAERLKKRIGDLHFQNYGLAILEIIDLVKEMTGI